MATGGGSRRQPLTVIITTAGDDKSRIWFEQDFLATNTLEAAADGTHSNDGLFAFVARLDDDDDWQDATLWPKANPNMPQAFPDGVPDWAEGMGTPKDEMAALGGDTGVSFLPKIPKRPFFFRGVEGPRDVFGL